MTVWAISVAGIILLTVLTDTILPDGKTNKYIKTVTTLVAIVVMISPLPAILNGDIPLMVFEKENSEMQLDQNYLNFVYSTQVETMKKHCTTALNDKGYENFSINIAVSIQDNKLSIKSVAVNAKNLVINNSDGNINIVEDIKKTLSELLSIDISKVTVHGQN